MSDSESLLVMLESVTPPFLGGVIGLGSALLLLKFKSFSVDSEAVTIAFTPSLSLAISGLLVAWLQA